MPRFFPSDSTDLTFTLPGFQQRVVRAVAVSVNDRLQIDTKMMVGGVTEVVEVMSPTSVQPTASLQTLIDSQQVQELPISNRNFAHLASIAPGVSSDMADEIGVGLTSTMNLSINGARRNAVNWLVDGVSNVDVGSNITLLSTPTLESIEEFKIITSSYAAEWPRSGGGIINVVTKSGTNQFSGSGYEFFRNDALNSNAYFSKQSTDPAVRDDPAPLRYNNFGYTLGGPLLPSREKAFFFWSQEWRRIKRAPASRTVNGAQPRVADRSDERELRRAGRPRSDRAFDCSRHFQRPIFHQPRPAIPAAISCWRRTSTTPGRRSFVSITT